MSLFVRNVSGWFGNEHESLLKAIEETLARLDGTLDAVLLSVRREVLCRGGNLLVCKSLEDVGNDLMKGLVVAWLKTIFVLVFELLLGQVQLKGHLLILLKLHD